VDNCQLKVRFPRVFNNSLIIDSPCVALVNDIETFETENSSGEDNGLSGRRPNYMNSCL